MSHRPRVVNMVHGYLFDDQTNFLKRSILFLAERITSGQTDLLLTMNQFDFEVARRFALGKTVRPIPGIGVDSSALVRAPLEETRKLREEYGIAPDSFVLIYAAEFSKRKNQAMLIRMLTQLPESITLVLAGSGDLLPQCRELVRQLHLEHRVIFPGFVRNIPLWYSMADIAVSSSRSEGLPFNVMEAMYLGLPVVASRVKGHEDLIIHGETGFLFPYDDAACCASLVLELYRSASLRQELADNAQESVLPYSLERVLPQVMDEYESLCDPDLSLIS